MGVFAFAWAAKCIFVHPSRTTLGGHVGAFRRLFAMFELVWDAGGPFMVPKRKKPMDPYGGFSFVSVNGLTVLHLIHRLFCS